MAIRIPAAAHDLHLETYVDLKDVTDLDLSPDGRWATVTVTGVSRPEVERQAAIWLVDLTGEVAARQLTAGTVNDTNARWSPDGTRIVFLSDRAERKVLQAYVLRVDGLPGGGGEGRSITSEPGGVSHAEWLPDGERLLVLTIAAQDKAEQERRKRERDDAKVSDSFHANATPIVVALDGTVQRRYPMEGHVAAAAVSGDGERVALNRWATPGIDSSLTHPMLGVLDLHTGEVDEIGESGRFGGVPFWSMDGTRVLTTAISAPSPVGSSQLVGVGIEEDGVREFLTRGKPWCVEGIVRDTPSGVAIRIAQGVESRLVAVSDDGEVEDLAELPGVIGAAAISNDGQTIAVLAQTPERPVEVYAQRGEGTFQRVTSFQDAAESIELGIQRVVQWERDGMALDAILILPPGVAEEDARGLPLICCVHGGPYGRWANGYYGHRFGRYLAALGYAVVYPNPRGGSGHGEAFAEAVHNCVGDDDYLDVMSSVDHLIATGLADPEELGICGWSQGGFMTAWAVGHTTRFGAAVMGAGVSDWGMMVATSDIPSYESHMGGGNPYEGIGPHGFDRQSPISFVSNATTPTLILHGENDERVPLNQAEFFYRGLRTYGVPTELVAYPREPHGVRERRHQIDLMQRTADWFQRWLPIKEQDEDADGSSAS